MLDPLVVAIEESDHIGFFIENEPVVRQMIVLRDMFHIWRKRLITLCEPDFLSRVSSEICHVACRPQCLRASS